MMETRKELECKLREARELAFLELVYLVDEIVFNAVERDKILRLEYNSVVWTPKGDGKGGIKGYELRVYEKIGDKTGKERVRQRYVASYPASEEIRQKLERLSYLYRLIRLIDHEPKRGALFRV